MIVDCDRCEVRGGACQDCVITVLLGAPPGGVELDSTERQALDTLAEAGMVPRLRLVRPHQDRVVTLAAPPVAANTGPHLGKNAERTTVDGERSRRHVS
ncbi:MAG: hypothetical protein ACRDRW_19925 [Pseudonocardiaceae bacterium]